jgi:TonB family protein
VTLFVDAAFRGLLAGLCASMWHGSLLALGTLLLERTLLRKAPPALLAALWTVVLLKFVIPLGPTLSISLSSLAGRALATTSLTLDPTSVVAASANSGHATATFLLECSGLLLYATLVAIGLGRLLLGRRRLSRWLDSLSEGDARLRRAVERAAMRIGVRVPRVLTHDGPGSPFVVGLLKPVMVVPQSQMLDENACEATLLHELAHLRRHDPWIRALQSILNVVLFFWPVFRWTNRRLEFWRELACDDEALRHGALSEREYARHLLETHRHVREASTPALAMAMVSFTSQLERRIDMLLNLNGKRWRLLRGGSLLVLGWAALALAGGVRAEEPIVGTGTLDKSVIANVIRSHLKEVQACYEQTLKSEPNLKGKVLVAFEISPTGTVTTASIQAADGTITNAAMNKCVVGAVQSWQFPKPKGDGNVKVTYPFIFDSK